MYTKHAISRMQQRGISIESVEFLLEFGCGEYHRHGEIIYFDKQIKRRLLRDKGKNFMHLIERCLGLFLVYADGFVITVGHRFHHFKHNRRSLKRGNS